MAGGELVSDLGDLMAEPPGDGGELHGRRRGGGGRWIDLSPTYHETRRLGFDYIVHTEVHGMRSTYAAGCRCDGCRRAEREYRRDLRKRARP